MKYGIATIRHAGKATSVVEINGRYWAASAIVPTLLPEGESRGWMALMNDDWPDHEALLYAQLAERSASIEPLPPPTNADDVLAPLLYPGKVCATGANYRQHLGEVGLASGFNKSRVRPSFFLKPPLTAVVGSGRSVRYPQQTRQFDWEIELAVVIGRTARFVDASQALCHIAGYTVGLDLSARDYLLHPGNMAGFDTFGGKGSDDSCPLGPAIVPSRFVDDPQQLSLKLWVNGTLQQDGSTAEMVWSVAEQIAEMSALMTLQPGDVILTGTPSGSGLSRGLFLQPGDRITAEIGQVGRLAVEIGPCPWAGKTLPCP
jgi:2-keto-4-pentenoate hydratase/2-oxohepta-3-ene-1,7-dioic acid hydratase in catechol pathway